MSRINTNVSSLIAQQSLAANNAALSTSLQRLSTGLRINSGADDPAGLIAAQSLDDESAGIQQAIDNANRASNIVGTAEGGLSEVSNLLTELQSLVSDSANTGGLSADEQSANQLQVDSILDTINRIAQSTTFEGTQLLNGNYSYTTSSVASTALKNVDINAASIPSGATLNVVVQVTASARTGQLAYAGGTIGSAGVTLQIAGAVGFDRRQRLCQRIRPGVQQHHLRLSAVCQCSGRQRQLRRHRWRRRKGVRPQRIGHHQRCRSIRPGLGRHLSRQRLGPVP
jgi:flagellin